MRSLIRIVVVAAVLAVPVSSLAQTTGQDSPSSAPQQTPAPKPPAPPKVKKPPVPRLPLGVRAYFLADVEMMTAADAFKTITGSSMLIGYGGGADIQNIWKKIFMHVGVSMASADGERGFLINGQFVQTGFPITIALRTIELGGGWRVWNPKSPNWAINLGGGLLFAGYKETSDFALPAENVDESFRGYYGQFGLEFALGKHMSAGVEALYRTIPDALGAGGVSAITGDTDLGGIVVRGLFGIRFSQKPKK